MRPRFAAPGLDSNGKSRASQEILKSRVVTKAVTPKRISDGTGHVGVSSLDGLQQPLQGELFLARVEVRDVNVDRCDIDPVHSCSQTITDTTHGSGVTCLREAARENVFDVSTVVTQATPRCRQGPLKPACDVEGVPEGTVSNGLVR